MSAKSFLLGFIGTLTLILLFGLETWGKNIHVPKILLLLMIVSPVFIFGFFLTFFPKKCIRSMPFLPDGPPVNKLDENIFRKTYGYEKRILSGKYGILYTRIIGIFMLISSLIFFYLIKKYT